MTQLPKFTYVISILTTLASIIIVALWSIALPVAIDWDDVISIVQACRPTSIEYGTLYHLAYCGITRFSPDLLLIFRVKQIAVLLLLWLLVFRFCRKINATLLQSAVISLWCILVSIKINGTAYGGLLVMLIGLNLVLYHPTYQWPILFFTFAAAFLIRTEYIVGLVTATLLSGYEVYKREHKRKDWLIPLFGGAISLGCIILFIISRWLTSKNPDNVPREWLAFGQHFALNWYTAYGGNAEPLMEWVTFVQKAFPNSHSIFEAFRENPQAFLWHISYNQTHFLFPALAEYTTPTPFIALQMITILILGVFIISGIASKDLQKQPITKPLLSLLPIPLYGTLIIRPTAEYFISITPLLLALCIYGINNTRQATNPLRRFALLIIGIILLSGLYTTTSSLIEAVVDPRPTVATAIQLLRTQKSSQSNILIASWYADRICLLAGDHTCQPINLIDQNQAIRQLDGNASLLDSIQQIHPAWIVTGPEWSKLHAIQSDPKLNNWRTTLPATGCQIISDTREGFTFYACH